jgi:hypothetical protein
MLGHESAMNRAHTMTKGMLGSSPEGFRFRAGRV